MRKLKVKKSQSLRRLSPKEKQLFESVFAGRGGIPKFFLRSDEAYASVQAREQKRGLDHTGTRDVAAAQLAPKSKRKAGDDVLAKAHPSLRQLFLGKPGGRPKFLQQAKVLTPVISRPVRRDCDFTRYKTIKGAKLPEAMAHCLDWAAHHSPGGYVFPREIAQLTTTTASDIQEALPGAEKILKRKYGRSLVNIPGLGMRATSGSDDMAKAVIEKLTRPASSFNR